MLREDQVQRYLRHILLPDVGGVGQARLLSAAVQVELGPDPAAEVVALAYLAAAGVGRLLLGGDALVPITAAEARAGILFAAADIGRPRLDAIAERVRALNPDVRVEPAPGPLADGSDLFAGVVALDPAPPMPAHLPADGPTDDHGVAPARPEGGAVAEALIIGGARAVRTLARLARPRSATHVDTGASAAPHLAQGHPEP
ncbi:ThiF family adenylyltransferase [Haliangium sp.]|uniref:ThiF family adenylyltransferase n=1 Tax=Haliangium sp. TaxID=2663208 RepID=UPI003D118CE6